MRIPLLACSACLLACSAFAVTVTGTVTTPDGRPAAAAEVCLYRTIYQQQSSTTTLVTTGRTVADGSFSLDDPQALLAGARPSWDLYLRLAGYPIVGWSVTGTTEPVALRLPPPVTREVTVTRPDGSPLPGVTLTPLCFSPVMQSRWSPRPIPRDVAGTAAVTSDAAGHAVLLMPAETVRVGLEVSGPGLATVNADLDVTPGAPRLSLQPAGSLKATISYPDASNVAGLEVSLQLADSNQGRTRLTQSQRTTTDAQGSFSATGLTPGRWSVTISGQPPNGEYRIGSRYLEIRSGEQFTADLKAQPTVVVRGRLVDATTRRGVSDLTVTYNAGGTTKTDADGRFLLHCTWGQGQLLFGPYDRLVTNTPFFNVMVMPDKPLDLPDIPVNVARQLEVVVTNPAGLLPQYVRVLAEQVHGQPYADREEQSCDAQGHCVLKRLTGGEARLRATAGDLASEVLSIRVEDQHEPVKLELRPGMLAATTVRVIYADGTPLAKGNISLVASRATPQFSLGQGGSTDANGVREDHGLEPGLTCKYTVTVPGCPTVASEEWVVVAGQTHDFGTLTLRPEPGFVAGVVVDDAGLPISGAMVFDGTDGPQPVETRTDDRGRFRVTGLYPGEAYLFAQAAGYRVNAACVPVGGGDVKLVLPRRQAGTLGTPLPLASPALAPDAARPLARQVLIAALARPGLNRPLERRRLLTLLARVDGDEAQRIGGAAGGDPQRIAGAAGGDPQRVARGDGGGPQRIAVETGAEADWVRMELARALLVQDTDQGLALVQAIPDVGCRVDVLLDVAETNRQAQPELARRCREEARLAFPLIEDTARRAVRAARLGADLLATDAATGKAIVLAARDDLLALGDRAAEDDRLQIAAGLAEVDLPSAVALLHNRNLQVFLILARRVAPSHPDEALNLLNAYGTSWDRDQALLQLLPYLPADRFTFARDTVLRSSRGNNTPALIRLCHSAPRERLPAWIEEVLGLIEPPAPERRGDGIQSTGERETEYEAMLALVARRLGYQEAREIMLRAVLSRLRNGSRFGSFRTSTVRDPGGQLHPQVAAADLRLAQAVALMEPKLARRLVPADALPDPRDLGLFAATLAVLDPLRGVDLLGQMPVGDDEKDRSYLRAAAAVAEALLLTSEERETALLRGEDAEAPLVPLASGWAGGIGGR